MRRGCRRIILGAFRAVLTLVREVGRELRILALRPKWVPLAITLVFGSPAQAALVVMDCDDLSAATGAVDRYSSAPLHMVFESRVCNPAIGHFRHCPHRRTTHRHYARHCRLKRRCESPTWAEPGDLPNTGGAPGVWFTRQEILPVYQPTPNVSIPEPPAAVLVELGGVLLVWKAMRPLRSCRSWRQPKPPVERKSGDFPCAIWVAGRPQPDC